MIKMYILDLILKSLWFFLPAYMANNAPVFAKIILGDKFDQRIDFSRTYKGKPLFGKTKTFRGFISGILVAIIIVYIQRLLFIYDPIKSVSIIDYSNINIFIFGFLQGFGALAGDLIKSFIKRRMHFKSGESWKPWDQIDFILGGLLFSFIIYFPPIDIIVSTFIVIPILKVIIDHVGFYLGLSKKW